MKQIKYIILLLMLVAISSCSSNEDSVLRSQMMLHLKAIDPYYDNNPFDVENKNTRSTDIGGSGSSTVQVGFQEGDTVGIFPNGGFQIPFKLPIVGNPVASVNILADGWDTKSSSLYTVYSPFNFYNRYYNKIPWDYRGPQKQVGNDTKDHLGKYWFLASDTVSAKVDANGTAEFGALMINMGSVLRCQTNLPVACTIVRMILVAQTKAFPTYGYYNLFDTTTPKEDVLHKFSSSPNISVPYLHQPFVAAGYTDHLTLDFPGGIPIAANGRIRAWLVSPEADLRLQNAKIYLWDSDGKCYVADKDLTSTTGSFCRNSVKLIGFNNAVLTTTPFTNLNPWEKNEDICPTCTPVAF